MTLRYSCLRLGLLSKATTYINTIGLILSQLTPDKYEIFRSSSARTKFMVMAT